MGAFVIHAIQKTEDVYRGMAAPNPSGTFQSRLICSRAVVLTEWNAESQAEKGMETMVNNSVELLEHAIGYAKKQGFRVRLESLEGATSGVCRVGKTTTIFLDQSTTAAQQLAEIMAVLRSDIAKKPLRAVEGT